MYLNSILVERVNSKTYTISNSFIKNYLDLNTFISNTIIGYKIYNI